MIYSIILILLATLVGISGCSSNRHVEPQASTPPPYNNALANPQSTYDASQALRPTFIQRLTGKPTFNTPGEKILHTGRNMTQINKEIIRGSCWDYIDAIYNRSGYTQPKRKIVYKSKKRGPYAPSKLIQPGDWLYYLNQSYRGIEHSAIFVKWHDKKRKEALMLSYVGGNKKKPARYAAYDLSKVYQIMRPKH